MKVEIYKWCPKTKTYVLETTTSDRCNWNVKS